jgi:hypothetical protein
MVEFGLEENEPEGGVKMNLPYFQKITCAILGNKNNEESASAKNLIPGFMKTIRVVNFFNTPNTRDSALWLTRPHILWI